MRNRRLSSVQQLPTLLIVVSDAREPLESVLVHDRHPPARVPAEYARSCSRGRSSRFADAPGSSSSPFPANRLVRFRARAVMARRGSALRWRFGPGEWRAVTAVIPSSRVFAIWILPASTGEQLNTSICSPTKPISDAGENIEYLKHALQPLGWSSEDATSHRRLECSLQVLEILTGIRDRLGRTTDAGVQLFAITAGKDQIPNTLDEGITAVTPSTSGTNRHLTRNPP